MHQQKAPRRGCRVPVILGAAAMAGVSITGLALAAATPASAAPAQAAMTRQGGAAASAACQPSYLPTPAGTVNSSVNNGDPTGRYVVGGATVVDSNGQPSGVRLIWTAGRYRPVDLPFSDGGDLSDINSSGVAVGTGFDVEGRSHAFTYRNGTVRELPATQPGLMTKAVAINSRGDILGSVIDTTSGFHERPVIWPAGQPGTIRQMPVEGVPLPAGTATPEDIDDDGTAIVQTGGFAPTGPAVAWRSDDTVTEIPAPNGGTSIAIAVRNGWVVGWENPPQGAAVSMLWNLRDGSVTSLPELSLGLAVNRYGDVGGSGPIIIRHSGEVIRPGGPSGSVRVLTDGGTAAGDAGDQAVVWRGC